MIRVGMCGSEQVGRCLKTLAHLCSCILIIAALMLLTTYEGGLAQSESFVGVAALFEIGMGARPMGMGNAFVGLADDENAAFYNPAALAFLATRGVTSLYTRQFGAVDYGALGFASKSLGLNFLQLYAPDIPVANIFGNPDAELISYVSRAGLVSLGFAMVDPIAVGSRLKFYHEQSGSISGSGWAIDPAVMLDLRLPWAPTARLRLGAIFENALSSAIQFSNEHAESWVPSLRVGGSLVYEFLDQKAKLSLLADISGVPDRPVPHVGVELWLENLGVRAGFDGGALTVGTSIQFKKESMRIDWAYAAHPQLPHSNRLSVTFRF